MLKIREFSLVERLTFTLVHLRPFYTSTIDLWAWISYEVNNVQMAPWRITWEMSFTSSQYLFSSSWSKSYTAFEGREYHKFELLFCRPQGNGISRTSNFSWLYVCLIPIITPLTSHISHNHFILSQLYFESLNKIRGIKTLILIVFLANEKPISSSSQPL